MNGAASGDGVEQIGEADPAEQFRTNAIRDAVDDLGAILGRVDMNSERPLAERHVHDPRNRFSHLIGVGIRWLEGAQPLQRNIGDVARRPVGHTRPPARYPLVPRHGRSGWCPW